MYPHIIYWKWNDEEWEGKFREGIEDIIRRSPFDLIYISLVWCKRRLLDDESLLKIKEAADILHKAGRGLMLDIDVRQERWEFARRYPHSLLGLVKTEVIELDSKGRGSVVSKCGGTGDHYGDYPVVDSRLLCALAFAGEDGWYRKDTLRDITSECRVVDRRPGEIKVDIDAGNAGKMRAWIALINTGMFPLMVQQWMSLGLSPIRGTISQVLGEALGILRIWQRLMKAFVDGIFCLIYL